MNNNSLNTNTSIDENSVLRLNKKVKKWPFVLLMLLFLSVIGFGVFLLIQSINKYNNYTVVGADLKDTKKIFEAGRPYYVGTYEYIVDGKKYYYDYPKKFEGNVDNVIQIRYNPKNPNELYKSSEFVICIIVISVGAILFFITIGILISVTSKGAEKIVNVVVEDVLTCVGGRKIYMRTVNENGGVLSPEVTEYFCYFTNQLQYFPIGKRIKFNAFKYGEALSTERYKDKIAFSVNEFKITDFIFYK